MGKSIVPGFRNTLHYFTYVMERYFRKNPPIPTHFYLSPEVMEDVELKIRIARHCRFPAILNTLINDENEQVRNEVQQNRYWELVGKYQDILGFDKRERKNFARHEGHINVFILLMFDDDPEVLAEAMRNPSVSIKMLIQFIKLLQERGTGRKDEQILELARAVMNQRKQQIVKIAVINKAAEQIMSQDNIRAILRHIRDDDRTVRKSIANILNMQDAGVLRAFVNASLQDEVFDHNLEQFIVISELLNIIKQREDLYKISVSALDTPEEKVPRKRYNSVGNFFTSLLSKKRLTLVRKSASNLTDFNNITLFAYCHVDKDSRLRKMAAEIMPLDDILELIIDTTTPRGVFKRILQILENHMDETVIEKVRAAYLTESRRLQEHLKELELTVQAYFDIIFQSLGYNKINEYMNVVRAIKTTQQQLIRFNVLIKDELGERQKMLWDTLDEVKTVLKRQANVLYFDTGPKIIQELHSIFNLIEEIFNLKEMGLNALRPGSPEETKTEISIKASTIWQSAISAYLGRIKDLTEMIRKKILKVAGKHYKVDQLLNDMEAAELDLERSYKEKIGCQLTYRCKHCTRRGCAAERYLREAHFFIKEFLDNFAENEG